MNVCQFAGLQETFHGLQQSAGLLETWLLMEVWQGTTAGCSALCEAGDSSSWGFRVRSDVYVWVHRVVAAG